ncbi:MAG: DUF5682 family protein [Sandaracinus sp.]
MSGEAESEAEDALERLTATGEVLLVGVRHHSPAMSAVMDALLDRFAPARVMIELPADLQPWMPHLAHPETRAPVALAGVGAEGEDLAFYPFADFSPELVAMRWAAARGIAMEAIDRPLAAPPIARHAAPPPEASGPTLLARLLARFEAPDGEHLWDHVVEARAPGASPESVRRAGLMLGWALRIDAARGGGVSRRELARETHMRSRLASARARGERVAVVVGAFHVGALVDPPIAFAPVADEPAASRAELVSSLVPYAFELLDARSGYPAGIRDPALVERRLAALREGPDACEALTGAVLVEVCRAMRRRKHVAGVPDAQEAARVALDLARLRGLPAPSGRELMEALETALGRGELLGRGRVIARACDEVLVGDRRGALAPGTPRSGLAPHVHAVLGELRLPGPDTKEPETLRLDPRRSPLDRRRHVALARLSVAGVPYGTEVRSEAAGSIETLGRVWRVAWAPATDAMIELVALRGVTLRQVAEGVLRRERERMVAEDRWVGAARVTLLSRAAEAGLGALVDELAREIVGPFLDEAGLADLVAAHTLLTRIGAGHVPGLPNDPALALADVPAYVLPADVDVRRLVAAAVRSLDGLLGSDREEDARAMLDLVRLFEADAGEALGDGRVGWAIDRLAREGAPLVMGAATALRITLGRAPASELGEAMAGWLDVAATHEGRRALARRLRGAMLVAAPLFESSSEAVDHVIGRVEALDDDAFLARVAALREGFDGSSPAARARLLDGLTERDGARAAAGRALDVTLDDDPAELARFAAADRAGEEALASWPRA